MYVLYWGAGLLSVKHFGSSGDIQPWKALDTQWLYCEVKWSRSGSLVCLLQQVSLTESLSLCNIRFTFGGEGSHICHVVELWAPSDWLRKQRASEQSFALNLLVLLLYQHFQLSLKFVCLFDLWWFIIRESKRTLCSATLKWVLQKLSHNSEGWWWS